MVGRWFVCDGLLCCLCLVVLLRFVWVCLWCISSQVCIVDVLSVCNSDEDSVCGYIWLKFVASLFCLWQRSQIHMTGACLFVCVVGPGFDLKDNSLLISDPNYSVTLFSPDPHQAKSHPRILIEDSQLPRVQCQNILGLYIKTSLSFNKHSGYVAERLSRRNNILKALAGTFWGQQRKTLLMTYKTVRRSIINYDVPVWSTKLRDTNYRNIQYTQNEALRIATGCHKMSSVDHLHV